MPPISRPARRAAFSLFVLGAAVFNPAMSCAQGYPPPSVGVVIVEPQRVEVASELPGRISPTRVAEVRPRIGGIVERRAKQIAAPRAALGHVPVTRKFQSDLVHDVSFGFVGGGGYALRQATGGMAGTGERHDPQPIFARGFAAALTSINAVGRARCESRLPRARVIDDPTGPSPPSRRPRDAGPGRRRDRRLHSVHARAVGGGAGA